MGQDNFESLNPQPVQSLRDAGKERDAVVFAGQLVLRGVPYRPVIVHYEYSG